MQRGIAWTVGAASIWLVLVCSFDRPTEAGKDRPPCRPGAATKPVSAEERASIELTNAGVKAYNSKQLDLAVGKLEEAIKAYPQNHTAWYSLGLAEDARKQYASAAKAYGKAVSVSPKDAMYQMRHGIALYKSVLDDAVVREARMEGKDPSEIDASLLDLRSANFDPALQALETAIALNADLFRAHHHVGRIHRHQNDAQKAAEAFTRAIAANPRVADSYVALGELYRRWDYTDEAIMVLAQGKAHVVGDETRGQLLLALGMAYMDKKDHGNAIPELTAALDVDKNLHMARYERGIAYYQTGDLRKARHDLEQYLKSARDEFTKSVAARTLLDLTVAEMGGAP